MGDTSSGEVAILAEYISPQFIRNASSLVALTVLYCEYLANFNDELRFIWRRPMNRVKGIYLMARYVGLFGLTVNVVLLFATPLSTIPVPVDHCRAWFSFLTVVSCLVLFSIDAIAMLRVYALYNRNARIGAFFSTLILIEATLVTTCSSRTIGNVPFSPICDVEKTPLQVLYFTCGVFFTQWSLLFFTFTKRQQMAAQHHVPIVKLVLREGAWMSTLISGIFSFTVPFSILTGTSKPHIVLVWPTVLLSIAACRVILSMHRLATVLQPTQRAGGTHFTNTDIQFTSFFDVPQSSYDMDSFRGAYEVHQQASSQPSEVLNRTSPTAIDTRSSLFIPISSDSTAFTYQSPPSTSTSEDLPIPPQVYTAGNILVFSGR